MARVLRRAMGLLLALSVILPVYRVLPTSSAGLPGAQAAQAGARYTAFLLEGTAVVILAALVAGLVFGPAFANRVGRIGCRVGRWSAPGVGVAAAVIAVASAAAFSHFGLGGRPVLLDAMSQLVHARYLAAGRLAGPVLDLPEFWSEQYAILTPRGWVSQYPPGHAALLALGVRLGGVWLVGPLLFGAAAFFTALTAAKLLPKAPAVARVGALAVGVSPLLILSAGSYMNHASATAFVALGAYAAVRARADGRGWAVLAGAAFGAAFTARPLTGAVLGAAIALSCWASVAGWRGLLRRATYAAAGVAPFVLAIGAYNRHFFGHPFRFGYTAAQGAGHGLGFHVDPWGRLYGPVEALGYTAADLVALGADLLGTPVSAVALVGVYLIVARRIEAGPRVLLAWALAPVVAHAFYWHHDLVLGPRMLAAAAPAWALLAVIAAVEIVRRVPVRLAAWPRWSPRAAATGGLLLAGLAAVGYLVPERLVDFANGPAARIRVEAPTTAEPSLVFVHGSWSGRVAARLAARGMALDSIRGVLAGRRLCEVQATLDARSADTGSPDVSRRRPGADVADATLACAREAASDRHGAVGLPFLLWRGDLPGLEPRGAMFVRDMGPARNERLLRAYPDRIPLVAIPRPNGAFTLVPFADGMARFWSADADASNPASGA